MRTRVLLPSVLFLFALASPGLWGAKVSAAGFEPVEEFLVRADSLWTAGGERALKPFVREKAPLIGAAVGLLLDVAFQARNQGEASAAEENLALAERLATLHAEMTGRSGPRSLVERQRQWTPAARELRKRAQELESTARRLRQQGDYEAALDRLDEAATLYNSLGDRRALAIVWGSRGVIHFYRNDYDAMQRSYQTALGLRRAVDDRILVGRTLNGLGTAALMKEDYPGAEKWYAEAIEMRRATGDVPGLITSLTYLGNALFRDGKLAQARQQYARARLLSEELGESGKNRRAELLSSEANVLDAMGRPSKAIDAYHRSIELYRELEDPRGELVNRLNLADALEKAGRPREALAELERCEGPLERAGSPADRIVFHRNRGQVRLDLGDVEGARDDVLEARKLAAREGLKREQASILIDLGFLYQELEALDRAGACAEEAETLARAERDSALLRDAAALAGAVALDAGDFPEALSRWEEALAIDRARGATSWQLRDELGRANALAALGRNAPARAAYRTILEKLEDSRQERLAEIALLGLGHTWEVEDPRRAREYYGRALQKVEERREKSFGESATGFFAHQTGWVFEEIVRYYAGLDREEPGAGWAEEAFRVAERGKARALLDRLQENEAGRWTEVQPAEAEGVQHALAEGEALLQYALGDSASFVFAIQAEHLQLVEIPPRSLLEAEVRQLRSALSRPGVADAQMLSVARKLHRQLIEPVAAEVAEAGRLIIVPDGALFDLPFEVLVGEDLPGSSQGRTAGAPPPDPAVFTEVEFLARGHAIAYAPSSAVYLHLLGMGSHSYGFSVLAVGDPDYSSISGGEFSDLPYAREEAESVCSLYPKGSCRLLLGPDASESALKAALTRSSPAILHLATHGLADAVEPSLSCVILGSGGGDDGYLRAQEIESLRPAPSLVVLSACETASGRVERGEGVVGLARSFLAGGSHAVVASLWPVADASTARLMLAFHRALREGLPAVDALARSRRELIDDPRFAHPFHWAVFVLVGDPMAPR